MTQYFDDMKLTRVEAATAAGTDDTITSATVDMAGYDAVLFFTTFGTITASAVTTIHVEQSADDSSYAELDDSSISVAADDDGQTFGIEIIRPRERYLQCVVTRATANAVVGEIYALQYAASKRPIVSTVTDVATFVSLEDPVEAE